MYKALPMDGCGAVFFQRRNMFLTAIPLVSRETILRKNLIIFPHQSVPGNFGNDAGGPNGDTLGISLVDRLLPYRHLGYRHRIVEEQIRPGIQLTDSLPHGLVGSLQNIDLVNPLGRGISYSTAKSAFHDLRIKFFSLFFGQLFGIINI